MVNSESVLGVYVFGLVRVLDESIECPGMLFRCLVLISPLDPNFVMNFVFVWADLSTFII